MPPNTVLTHTTSKDWVKKATHLTKEELIALTLPLSDDSLADVFPASRVSGVLGHNGPQNKEQKTVSYATASKTQPCYNCVKVDKDTSDITINKEIRASEVQTSLSICDAATEAALNHMKSVSALTSRCVLPPPLHCSQVIRDGGNSADCLFVYDKPRCIVHKSRTNAAVQMCSPRPRRVTNLDNTKLSARSVNSSGTMTSCKETSSGICGRNNELISEVLSPKMYKVLYDMTKYAADETRHASRPRAPLNSPVSSADDSTISRCCCKTYNMSPQSSQNRSNRVDYGTNTMAMPVRHSSRSMTRRYSCNVPPISSCCAHQNSQFDQETDGVPAPEGPSTSNMLSCYEYSAHTHTRARRHRFTQSNNIGSYRGKVPNNSSVCTSSAHCKHLSRNRLERSDNMDASASMRPRCQCRSSITTQTSPHDSIHEAPSHDDEEKNERFRKIHTLEASSFFYGNFSSKQLGSMKCRQPATSVEKRPSTFIKEACTMKPSGREELACQTWKKSNKKFPTPMSCCLLSPSASLTNICKGCDRNNLKSFYTLLTAIEGRCRRMKNFQNDSREFR